MGTNYKEVGGGAATGLADQLIKALTSGISGSFGGGTSAAQAGAANPAGSTMGMMGFLNDLFSGGAGKLGGSINTLINQQETRDVNALRARFGVGGGSAFGTPGAYAESQYRSQVAPQLTQAIGGLQMQGLGNILPIMASLASKGITQRENVAQQSPWLQAAGIAGQLGQTAAGIFTGNPLLALNGLSGLSQPQLPALTPSTQNTTSYASPQYIQNVSPLFAPGQPYYGTGRA